MLFTKIAAEGFFHIFLTSALNKILSFLCAVLVVRILSKTDYGVYSYAFNLLNIALLFNGLGAASSVLQLASESRQPLYRKWLGRFALKIGLTFDLLLCAFMLLVAFFVPLPIEGSSLLLALCVAYPMPQFVFELQSVLLRSEFRNKQFASATNINTLLTVIASVGGAAFGGSIGLIVGRNLAIMLSIATITWKYKVPDLGSPLKDLPTTRSEKKDFFKIGIISSVNNGLSTLTYLAGTFFIGFLLSDANLVASYQAATTIPVALNFIPAAVVTFVYPYFARNKDNRSWLLQWYPRLLGGVFLVAAIIAVPCIITAPHIIELVYGLDYLDAVPSFIVLMVGFVFMSSLRIVSMNLLVTQRKLLFNTGITIVTFFMLTILCMALIPLFGLQGAAFAQTASFTFSGIISTPYLLYVYKSLK